jgi:hypothetical protein
MCLENLFHDEIFETAQKIFRRLNVKGINLPFINSSDGSGMYREAAS